MFRVGDLVKIKKLIDTTCYQSCDKFNEPHGCINKTGKITKIALEEYDGAYRYYIKFKDADCICFVYEGEMIKLSKQAIMKKTLEEEIIFLQSLAN
jgi:hypothetical protein